MGGSQMSSRAGREQAVVDLVGALCYALLHTFEAAARGATAAPSIELAEEQQAFAADESDRFKVLRARLAALTDAPEEAMATFRSPLDSFYSEARPEGWLETQVFHFVGDTITTDFAELVAARLDPETADAVRHALTGRTEHQAFALQQIGEAVEREGSAAQDRIAQYAGTIVGKGLNTLRGALLENDALEVVLDGEAGVKEMVLELLGRHRERLERLGLDRLDD
ncbi:MAG: ferritin-like fold-containing protein [Actinomycetota bacterium]